MCYYFSVMLKKPLFKELFVVLFAVYILNVLALKYNWYWSITEFDSLVHFLGGMWAALVVLWFYFFSGFLNPQDRGFKNFFFISLLGLIFISVAWEIFELVSGATFVVEPKYRFDTALDFVMDFLGGAVALLYAYLINISYAQRQVEVKGQAPENLPT